MAISVALCTRNGSRYVRAQIESILRQSLPVDEIILSDDASTDATVEIVEDVVRRHAELGVGAGAARSVRLVVRRNQRALGVTANFEQALRAATGEIVVLSDQDDVWHPERVRRAADVLISDPTALLVASDARLVDAAGRPSGGSLFRTLGVDHRLRHRLDSPSALDELLRRNLLTGATMTVARDLIARAVPIPSSWVHDEWLAVVAAANAGVRVLSQELVDYRQHGDNVIGVTRLRVSDRVGRLTASRTERNRRLLERASDLAERLPRAASRDDLDSLLAEKLAHERVRSALPANRLARVVPVLRERRTGRYRRFGHSADILRDLVQPV